MNRPLETVYQPRHQIRPGRLSTMEYNTLRANQQSYAYAIETATSGTRLNHIITQRRHSDPATYRRPPVNPRRLYPYALTICGWLIIIAAAWLLGAATVSISWVFGLGLVALYPAAKSMIHGEDRVFGHRPPRPIADFHMSWSGDQPPFNPPGEVHDRRDLATVQEALDRTLAHRKSDLRKLRELRELVDNQAATIAKLNTRTEATDWESRCYLAQTQLAEAQRMIQGQQTQIDSLGFENRYLNDGLRRAAIEAQSARMGRQEAHAKVRQAYADGHRDGRAEGADPTRPIESYSLAVDPGPLAGLTDVPHVGAEAVAAEKIHAMPAGFDYTTASNDPVVAIARKDPFDADTD